MIRRLAFLFAAAIASQLRNAAFWGNRQADPAWTLDLRVKQSPQWKQLRTDARGLQLAPTDREGALKFLHLNFWRQLNVERAVRLGLHHGPRLKIVDLGTGPGFFPFVCHLCGHDVLGVDRPLKEFNDEEALVYSLGPSVLGVPVIRQSIAAFTPLNLPVQSNLITAYMICFNRHKKPDEWGRSAWEFFLRDAAKYLMPEGRICLGFNPHEERYGDLRFWDQQTLELLEAVGHVTPDGMVVCRREDITRLLA